MYPVDVVEALIVSPVSLAKLEEAEFTLAGKSFKIALHGVRATIVDYGLSRLTVPGVGVLFTNFKPEMFESFDGDDPRLREVYRAVRSETG
jgi:hypothetical protein